MSGETIKNRGAEIIMENQKKIQILKDIIQIQSVNGDEKLVADYLQSLLKEYGIESKQVVYADNRSNLVAEIGTSAKKVLGFTGHMDVVDAGNPADWTYPPFSATEADGKIYGRGSTDMKSGLAAMVVTMIELVEEGLSLDGTLRLLATVGEEIGELGSAQLTDEGYADDLDGLIVGEPSNYVLCYAHKGALNYELVSKGKEAHSSMPELGINAINNMTEAMNALNARMNQLAEKYVDEALGKMTHHITVINGGNQVNSIPNKCTIEANIRTIPECSNDVVKEEITKVVAELNQKPDFDLSLSFYNDILPAKSTPDSQLIQELQALYDQKFGGQMPVVAMPGGTDASQFVRGKKEFEFVIFGPGENTLPHQIDEYVEIQNYLDVIDMYKTITKKFING